MKIKRKKSNETVDRICVPQTAHLAVMHRKKMIQKKSIICLLVIFAVVLGCAPRICPTAETTSNTIKDAKQLVFAYDNEMAVCKTGYGLRHFKYSEENLTKVTKTLITTLNTDPEFSVKLFSASEDDIGHLSNDTNHRSIFFDLGFNKKKIIKDSELGELNLKNEKVAVYSYANMIDNLEPQTCVDNYYILPRTYYVDVGTETKEYLVVEIYWKGVVCGDEKDERSSFAVALRSSGDVSHWAVMVREEEWNPFSLIYGVKEDVCKEILEEYEPILKELHK